jgi:hypothetical protein
LFGSLSLFLFSFESEPFFFSLLFFFSLSFQGFPLFLLLLPLSFFFSLLNFLSLSSALLELEPSLCPFLSSLLFLILSFESGPVFFGETVLLQNFFLIFKELVLISLQFFRILFDFVRIVDFELSIVLLSVVFVLKLFLLFGGNLCPIFRDKFVDFG